MAHFISGRQPVSLVDVQVGSRIEVQLWGDGPNGERLDVTSTNPDVAQIEEIPASIGPQLRGFLLRGMRRGSAQLQARVGVGGLLWGYTRVIVGEASYNRYYHGTTSTGADRIVGDDLTPHLLAILITTFDWKDYTDFGKGFYVHLEANKAMAYEWARGEFGDSWAVVELIATPDEFRNSDQTQLLFQNKSSRPHNSPRPITVQTTTRSLEICAPVPQLLPIVPCVRLSSESTRTTVGATMSWLEFVEHNRHIVHGGALIARPNDRDWTNVYSSMRGPIWRPRDSGYNAGGPIFPDDLHQVNCGLNVMAMLNEPQIKLRRFKFSKDNEGLFPPPA